MLKFIGKRILILIPTLVLISIIVFVIQKIIPGDPAVVFAGEDATPELIEQIKIMYHLNEPIYTQYFLWIFDVLHGNLGVSIKSHTSVLTLIISKFPATCELAILSMIIALGISIPMGVISASNKGSVTDLISSVLAIIGQSVPNFWLGFLLILFISVKLKLLPASGYTPITTDPLMTLKTLIMPAFVLGTGLAGSLFRHTRSSMIETLSKDYIRTARAKGVKRKLIIYKHALRNAVTPILTMSTIQFGSLLGGTVMTEQIFSIPGIGKLIVDSIFTRDFFVVQGVVIFSAIILVLMNLVADVGYLVFDPKLRSKEL